MTSSSGRGRWLRVLEARSQARLELGEPDGGDYGGTPKRPSRPPEPLHMRYVPNGPGIRVLSLGEAAVRLRVSRAELERMIDAGRIEALPTGCTRMIRTSEVERLDRSR